jgi:phage replication-related protein YjqB (UPF0714/DUF867 family)
MSNNEGPFFNAQFKLDPLPPNEGGLADEHCKAKLTQIQDIGRHRHEQVRIEFRTTNDGTTSAIYTVSVFHPDAGSVILGPKIKALLPNCKLTSNNTCEGKVKAQIMIEGLNDTKAEELGELVEHLTVGQNRKLIVIAPHGGEIEPLTDKQAQHVGNHLPHDRVSLWICKGFSNPGAFDAHERWHITSTEISERSFPKLKTIFEPKFEYAIAFHGWGQDSICVGGNAESADAGLIGEIKDAIKHELQGTKIEVEDTACRGGFNGDDPCNIVNRLGLKGIQIEQSKDARKDHWEDIAQAVVDVIGPRINV